MMSKYALLHLLYFWLLKKLNFWKSEGEKIERANHNLHVYSKLAHRVSWTEICNQVKLCFPYGYSNHFQLLSVLTVYLDLAWLLTLTHCPRNTVSKDSKNDGTSCKNIQVKCSCYFYSGKCSIFIGRQVKILFCHQYSQSPLEKVD